MLKKLLLHLFPVFVLLTTLVLTACQPVQPLNDQGLGTQLDALLTKLNQAGTFNGAVLIAHRGQVVLRKGYGLADRAQQIPNTPTTRFRLASLTKQFTAVAILLLQEQGKLRVQDHVCQYVEGCPASWQEMTIQQLLTHTAGVYDFRDFIYTGPTPPKPSTSAQVIERIKAKPLAFAPGQGWSYTNGGFMVAGYIVEKVSGEPYEQYLREHIFAPLGLKDTGYAHDATSLAVGYRNATTQENPLDGSLPFAAAGLYSTVDDLYRYTQALESGKLLSAQSLALLFGRHARLGADNGGFTPGYEPPAYYAYGWAVATFKGHRVIGHDGWIEGYGGDLRRYPDDHITTILLMNLTEPYAAPIGDQIAQTIFSAETVAAPEDAKIQNAMSAAPLAIAKEATILDSTTTTAPTVLRKGTNGWICYPDTPDTPSKDPMCVDETWSAWMDAITAKSTPKFTMPGLSYMLQGGTDPSNTDPFATKPPAGADWVASPPHLMVIVPSGIDLTGFSTDPKSGMPYVMFAGTPFAHLMVPVKMDEFQEANPRIRNAMSAAPLAIAKDATILDWPAKEGEPMVVLRKGTNDWTCITDWPTSPGNDPSCNDPVWTAWNDAYAQGKAPQITKPGIAYMLAGGSDPSETDPAAMKPAPGEDWITTPPHIMLLVPGGFDVAHFTTDYKSGKPYVMWDGTPYEHLMVPVADKSATANQ